jgi:uncharacterized metal-binding protein
MSAYCPARKTLLFACSGGSKVGQPSPEAATQHDWQGVSSLFCAAVKQPSCCCGDE